MSLLKAVLQSPSKVRRLMEILVKSVEILAKIAFLSYRHDSEKKMLLLKAVLH